MSAPVRGRGAGRASEQSVRFEKNRRLVDLVAERYPSGPVVGGLSADKVFLATLRWQLAADPNYLQLNAGLHLADLPKVCEEYPLSKLQTEALFGSLMIEDHIPGYTEAYNRMLTVEGEVDPDRRQLHRRLRSMVAKWTEEESSHADGFLIALLLSNAADVASCAEPEAMVRRLNAEAEKPYVAPYQTPAALFVYAAAQEKATQLYYHLLLQGIENPIVQVLLERFQSQEARHCAFFSENVREALDQGDASVIEAIQELLVEGQFEMPLARMIDDYLRWAARMRRVAKGYDARNGLEVLRTQVRKVAEARSGCRDHPVHGLVALLLAPSV